MTEEHVQLSLIEGDLTDEQELANDMAPEVVETVSGEQKVDVLGLAPQAIWLIADAAKMSRGKVRRVLGAFEPLFWSRLQEAYDNGYYTSQIDFAKAMEELKEEGAYEYSDDPEGTEVSKEIILP